MNYLGCTILAIAVLALTVAAIAETRGQREIRLLKQRYRQLTFASPRLADEAMRLQVVRLKNMAPGRSERWYLERLVHELESGRMRNLHEVKKGD